MILFIDDTPRRVERDVLELKSRGFEVELTSTVDTAFAFFKESSERVEGIVCDIMLPPGSLDIEITRDGLRTGLAIVETIRDVNPILPIVIFTNVTQEALPFDTDQGKHLLYLYKPDYLPRQFADRVQEFMAREKMERGLALDGRVASDPG
jgi:DNA-binding NarL/FixJ family response regulator